MIALEVRGARGIETRTGIFWSGVLFADGVAVLRFENRGDGSSTHFDWKPRLDRAPIKAALRAMAPTVSVEAEDAALGILWDAAMLSKPPA